MKKLIFALIVGVLFAPAAFALTGELPLSQTPLVAYDCSKLGNEKSSLEEVRVEKDAAETAEVSQARR